MKKILDLIYLNVFNLNTKNYLGFIYSLGFILYG